jgi:hypothetical protein
MTDGSIGIGFAPSQDGGAIDDQNASTNEAATEGDTHQQYEQAFGRWRACRISKLPLLGEAGNVVLAVTIQRQTTGRSQYWPGS